MIMAAAFLMEQCGFQPDDFDGKKNKNAVLKLDEKTIDAAAFKRRLISSSVSARRILRRSISGFSFRSDFKEWLGSISTSVRYCMKDFSDMI